MSAAPDYVEPVEGWRVWAVVDIEGVLQLRSIYHDVPWQPESPVAAVCLKRGRPFRRLWRRSPEQHVAPSDTCTCGIYAAADSVAARRYLDQPPEFGEVCRVLGRVALWGTVVECEQGWRASHAYPTRLYLPQRVTSRRLRAPTVDGVGMSLARYAVPLETLD